MNQRVQTNSLLQQTAGLRLRCFLGAALVLGLINVGGFALAQVDCVQNHTLKVGNIQGVVVDPFGTAIPDAVVTVTDRTGRVSSTKTDAEGRFSIRVPREFYKFKATVRALKEGEVELVVRRSLWISLERKRLYVVLGLAGSYCPWVTTNQKDFEYNIRANKKRSKEFEQKNATQK